MCYNYTPELKADTDTFKRFRVKAAKARRKDLFSSYYSNGFNHEELPVITMEQPDMIQYYSWGLVPSFIRDMQGAKDIRKKTLNARSETVFTTASYKQSIKDKRCLVLAQGFTEWHHAGKEKYPYHIQVFEDHFPDGMQPFAMAGIYNNWVDKDTGEVLDTFSILTTEANELMQYVHNSAKRMPVILRTEDEQKWLDPSINFEDLDRLMRPYPSHRMVAYSISKLINSRAQTPDDPAVLDLYDYGLPAVPSIVSMQELELDADESGG